MNSNTNINTNINNPNENNTTNARTIESELPDAKYIKKFSKKYKESPTTYRVDRINLELEIELPSKFKEYDKIQKQLVEKGIEICTMKVTEHWLTGNTGIKYEGISGKTQYTLTSKSTSNYAEEIHLKVHTTIIENQKAADLVSVVNNYVIEYEKHKNPKPKENSTTD